VLKSLKNAGALLLRVVGPVVAGNWPAAHLERNILSLIHAVPFSLVGVPPVLLVER